MIPQKRCALGFASVQLLMIGDAGKQAEPECGELERLQNGEARGGSDYDGHRDLDGGVMAADD
jgi:hypothetical protein